MDSLFGAYGSGDDSSDEEEQQPPKKQQKIVEEPAAPKATASFLPVPLQTTFLPLLMPPSMEATTDVPSAYPAVSQPKTCLTTTRFRIS